MKRYDFNTGWTCRPLSREGEAVPVTLPHDAMRTEQRVSTSLGEGNIGWFEGGDYEYRKVFSIPDDLRRKNSLPALWIYKLLRGSHFTPSSR